MSTLNTSAHSDKPSHVQVHISYVSFFFFQSLGLARRYTYTVHSPFPVPKVQSSASWSTVTDPRTTRWLQKKVSRVSQANALAGDVNAVTCGYPWRHAKQRLSFLFCFLFSFFSLLFRSRAAGKVAVVPYDEARDELSEA